MKVRQLFLLASILLIGGCKSEPRQIVVFGADEIPERLSDWRLLIVEGNSLRLNGNVVPYDLNTPLSSDYALKLRTVWMPPETSAKYRSDREFDFPVGTIISKTFHYKLANGDVEGIVRVVKADREAVLSADGTLDLDD